MVQKYSQEKLISIIYAEAPFQDYFDLDQAMQHNTRLAEEFRALYASHRMLQTIHLSPNQKTMKKILDYSKS